MYIKLHIKNIKKIYKYLIYKKMQTEHIIIIALLIVILYLVIKNKQEDAETKKCIETGSSTKCTYDGMCCSKKCTGFKCN